MGEGALFVAQSGGPTSVINSTLAGIIAAAQKKREIEGIYGLLHGLEGALRGEIIYLDNLRQEELERLAVTPGAILGGSRYHLREEDLDKIASFLIHHKCRYLLLIGGNGTMETCLRLQRVMQQKKAEVEIVGVPKTVDNDLVETDHAPGYLSAARYVALAVRDQLMDLESMSRFEQVRIIETMGRSVGWLAAASFLAVDPINVCYPIFIPEVPLDEDEFLSFIDKIYRQQGFALAVIGEGVIDKQGQPLGIQPFNDMDKEKGCHVVRTGAAENLARLVTERLGLRARAQVLGMNQRSFSTCVSSVDREEAYEVGRAAVELALQGGGGNMITLQREGCLSKTGFVSLERVAGAERKLPLEFYDSANKKVTPKFVEWIMPLVGELGPSYLYRGEIMRFFSWRRENQEIAWCGGINLWPELG
ncbi:6-phosphofructokinase 1 [Thermanaeromonas toyohensis ToBE]|uniref:Pyrophosphate--fructose 6-phosphate 1-phosphotransferase n=1 Tax=Thermanaeromonas toyohensis ToBE TaxID=698762 RepID=A0A1W1VVJ6_9FIRM|nr:diphosphate--fructose-6-phosphate 1-phosphotransferase [Thermanaeromonas toyohensis]SMB97283.1 6-phosphofructokinase 1 [Thermanaeromonas toyohensis ToBE]